MVFTFEKSSVDFSYRWWYINIVSFSCGKLDVD